MTFDIMTILQFDRHVDIIRQILLDLDRSGEILPDLGRPSYILQFDNLTLLTFDIDDIVNI